MAIDGVTQTNQTGQTAPTDHGFGAMVRQMTPAAHNIPPGLQRKQEAGQDVKNWKLVGDYPQTELAGDAGAAGEAHHGEKADETAATERTEASTETAGGKGQARADKAARSG